jgi:hypothetical protein
MATIKENKTKTSTTIEDAEKLEPWCSVGGNVNGQVSMESSMGMLQKLKIRAGGMAQVLRMPCKLEALSSNPSATKSKTKQKLKIELPDDPAISSFVYIYIYIYI